jgi:hypothetical protein
MKMFASYQSPCVGTNGPASLEAIVAVTAAAIARAVPSCSGSAVAAACA